MQHDIRAIEGELQTPCFIVDEKELKLSVRGFHDALQTRFANAVVGYSVKTNSTPFCMQTARDEGAYAEVVSHDEYELALLCGFPKERIVYNGPMKSKQTFLDAMENGAVVNIETKRELQWLDELDHAGNYRVGLRLNINISHVSPDDADGENDNSRFGFSDDTTEFSDALAAIGRMPHVRLAGLHIHRTAHSRSLRFYERSVRHACAVIRKHHLSLDYIDVGGGYFGRFPNKPTYQDYADAIHRPLADNELAGLTVIVEPGNALVASCITFVSEVIDTKRVEPACWFITTDGSRNDIDPFFRKTAYLDEEIYRHADGPTVPQQVVAGCTCLEYDRLFILHDKPLLHVGDRIVYHNVGAYTMCLTPNFIRYVPSVYALTGGGKIVLAREKWTACEFVQKTVL